jgi:hypothetical protein
LGCPLAATICDAADNDSLRTHVSELLARWRAPVADAYTRFGAPLAEAETHATVLMAALEGALVLARAQRNIEPLDTVERFFASRSRSTSTTLSPPRKQTFMPSYGLTPSAWHISRHEKPRTGHLADARRSCGKSPEGSPE